jgi:LmbE family N-acetylglucosaminyl deacetylase
MLELALGRSTGPLTVLALGAHADDIEIGCGGTLLRLAAERADLSAHVVVLSATPDRELEARASAAAFLPGAGVEVHDLPDGRFPAYWLAAKELLEGLARRVRPDVVLAPSPGDAHQDHRTLAELVATCWRDVLVLQYEIPKWDGDIGRPNTYVPLSEAVARQKVELLHKHFGSQVGRDWFDEELFLGLARLRGVECRARYAEAFTCRKAVLLP